MADVQKTTWLFGWVPRSSRRESDIREALTTLAAKFDRDAEGYRRKCKDGRADYYQDMASAIRNHIDWTCEQVVR